MMSKRSENRPAEHASQLIAWRQLWELLLRPRRNLFSEGGEAVATDGAPGEEGLDKTDPRQHCQ